MARYRSHFDPFTLMPRDSAQRITSNERSALVDGATGGPCPGEVVVSTTNCATACGYRCRPKWYGYPRADAYRTGAGSLRS